MTCFNVAKVRSFINSMMLHVESWGTKVSVAGLLCDECVPEQLKEKFYKTSKVLLNVKIGVEQN